MNALNQIEMNRRKKNKSFHQPSSQSYRIEREQEVDSFLDRVATLRGISQPTTKNEDSKNKVNVNEKQYEESDTTVNKN